MPIKPKPLSRPWNQFKKRGEKMEFRPRSRAEYHTARWTRESKAFREAHPLCAECEKKGLIVPAEVVDHIIPVEVCDDFWNPENWRPLCRKCNIQKGNRDKKLINDGRRDYRNNQTDERNPEV